MPNGRQTKYPYRVNSSICLNKKSEIHPYLMPYGLACVILMIPDSSPSIIMQWDAEKQ